MAFYAAAKKASNPGTTNDFVSFTSAAFRFASLHEISLSGLGTSSVANELVVSRVTVVGVGSNNLTISKINPLSPSALSTVTNTWATSQPTPDASMLLLGCNSNGGVYRWIAKPGEQISCYDNSTTGQISMRFDTGGTDTFGIHVVFEEA